MSRDRARRDVPQPRAARHATRGFTLLEVLVVVTLIAALSVIVFGTMSGGIDGLRMRSAAKELATELRFARAHAIATGSVQRFAIVPAERSWTGAKSRHGEVPKTLAVKFIGVRQVQAREGEGVVLFFEDGASTGGRIQLSHGNAAWNIDVAWLTGEIGVHRGEAGR